MASLAPCPEPLALRQHRYFESRDLDDTRSRISHVLQPHHLAPTHGRPRIRAHMDFMRFGGAVIGALDFGDEMTVALDHMDDYYLFVCCLRGHAEIRNMGERTTIGLQQGAVCIPGAAFAGHFSADCEQFFLRLDRAAVTRHTGADLLHFDPRMDFTRPELAPWLAQFRLLASEPALAQLAQRDERIAAEFERMLVTLLVAGLPHRSAPATTGSIAPRAVRRAEDYIAAHASEAICLDDIARAAGVPARTLLDGFRRFRGTSPMQAVREHRLKHARELLLHAAPGTRVADVALECGFTHFGRFAATYHQRHGEAPSETLRRRTSPAMHMA